MTSAATRVGVGTRFTYGGEVIEVVQLLPTASGIEVAVRAGSQQQLRRLPLRELLTSGRARVVPDGPGPAADDPGDIATVALAALSEPERRRVVGRAEHVREVLTGYRAGTVEFAEPGEPRPEFDPSLPMAARYAAKAAELDVGIRTLERWVHDFRAEGAAGLARAARTQLGNTDERWVDTALEVMVEHTEESRPSRTMVIRRTNARVVARFGEDAVKLPSRATAFRVLEDLERRHPTFRLSTKRNREIAERPGTAYGKLRASRPGEYLLMDTTRSDVFALDPVTLRWVQAELTVGMDLYSRCVTGLRVSPVSTKSVDAATVLYQAFRPRPAGKDWPDRAVWPEHGVPRSVLIEADAVERSTGGVAGPAIVPETLVVDHGKIYLSEHLTSVCNRLGISVQPVRLGTGRDKGPVERFFRTLREDLLQALPGYKGPDVYSRGLSPESEAFFYLDELEAIIREWVAVVYHHRPHDGLVDPHLPGLRLSPAMMFEHGVARAGYIEAPRDPDLAFEFLPTVWRTIQHYGVEYGGRRYDGPALNPYRDMASPYSGQAKHRWPLQVDPDDVTRVFFRDPATRRWHPLVWEHAPSLEMPLSDDALRFARRLAAAKYTYPDDRIAVADLLERWHVGLAQTRAERRMALRLAREQAELLATAEPAPDEVTALPSVARVLKAAAGEERGRPDAAATSGDEPDDGDFYADALEDV